MPNRQVLALLEFHGVKLLVSVKNAVLKDVFELKVRFDGRFIDLILLGSDLFRIVLPIPRLRWSGQSIPFHRFRDQPSFGFDLVDHPRDQILQHLHSDFRIASHLVFKGKGRMIAISKQPGSLRSEFGKFQNNRLVVNSSIFPERSVCTGQPKSLSKRSVFKRCESRLPSRIGDRK